MTSLQSKQLNLSYSRWTLIMYFQSWWTDLQNWWHIEYDLKAEMETSATKLIFGENIITKQGNYTRVMMRPFFMMLKNFNNVFEANSAVVNQLSKANITHRSSMKTWIQETQYQINRLTTDIQPMSTTGDPKTYHNPMTPSYYRPTMPFLHNQGLPILPVAMS